MSADKLMTVFRAKVAKRQQELIERLLQLNADSMNELGEKYTQAKSQLVGLQQGAQLAEDALMELLGGERPDETGDKQGALY